MTTVSEPTSIQEYLKHVTAGLKGMDEAQKQETLAEISSHLSERAAELEAQGTPHPIEQAISGLGDPAELASAFVAVAQAKRGIRSYAPWRYSVVPLGLPELELGDWQFSYWH